MKYIFWGTPRFAAIVLDGLLRGGMPPVALVCNPDRPVGRKKIITPPQTKKLIAERGATISILQPEILDGDLARVLKTFEPDLFVVAAYAKIIPKTVLGIPRLGTLGVHPSLLPHYRGASPIQSVILNGEKVTGISLYMIDEKMDHGAIVAQENCDAGSGTMDYLALEEKLAALAGEVLVKTLPMFAKGDIHPKMQDEAHATYTKKFTTEDAFVIQKDLLAAEQGNPKKAEEILQKINAFSFEPGAWTMKGDKRIKLLGARIENGALKISKIQEEGQKARTI